MVDLAMKAAKATADIKTAATAPGLRRDSGRVALSLRAAGHDGSHFVALTASGRKIIKGFAVSERLPDRSVREPSKPGVRKAALTRRTGCTPPREPAQNRLFGARPGTHGWRTGQIRSVDLPRQQPTAQAGFLTLRKYRRLGSRFPSGRPGGRGAHEVAAGPAVRGHVGRTLRPARRLL